MSQNVVSVASSMEEQKLDSETMFSKLMLTFFILLNQEIFLSFA